MRTTEKNKRRPHATHTNMKVLLPISRTAKIGRSASMCTYQSYSSSTVKGLALFNAKKKKNFDFLNQKFKETFEVKSLNKHIKPLQKTHIIEELFHIPKNDFQLQEPQIWKKWGTWKNNQSIVFCIWKGDKDAAVHVSLEEDIKFKGAVSRTKDLKMTEWVFSDRFYDFTMIGMFDLRKFYVHIVFLEDCRLNICFKTTLFEPTRILEIRNRDPTAYEIYWGQKNTFQGSLYNELDEMSNSEAFRYSGWVDPNISHKKKNDYRAKSFFSREKKPKTSFQPISIVQERKSLIQESRVAKLKETYLVKEMTRLMKQSNSINNKVRRFQNAWVRILRFGLVMLKITERFDARVLEIKRLHILAYSLIKSGSTEDWLKYPEILKMYISN